MPSLQSVRRFARDNTGATKIEHVALLSTVTLALLIPFSALGRFSSERFIASDADEARNVIALRGTFGDEAHLIPPRDREPESSEPSESSDTRGSANTHESSDARDAWSHLIGRTLSRLLWMVTEELPFLRSVGRAHAVATGQLDSYDVFTRSARKNIHESWDNMVAMVRSLPSLTLNDATAIPGLVGGMAISRVTYPFIMASTFVYGSDEDAGATAGALVFDVWTTKGVAAAGLGAYALKASRVSRIFTGIVRAGDRIGASLLPRGLTFAGAHAHAGSAVSLRGTRMPATANHVVAMRGMGGLPDPTGLRAQRAARIRELVPSIDASTARIAAASDTFFSNLEAAASRGLLPRPRQGSRTFGSRQGSNVFEAIEERGPIDHLAHWAGVTGAVRYQARAPAIATNASFVSYVEQSLPSRTRTFGQGVMARIEVRAELLHAYPSDYRIRQAFYVNPQMERAYDAYGAHGNMKLLHEELGLLYLRSGFGGGSDWGTLPAQLEALRRTYGSAVSPRGTLVPESVDPRLVSQLRNDLSSHLAVVRAFRETRVPTSVMPVDPELARSSSRRFLVEAGFSDGLATRGMHSPKLAEDVRALRSEGWSIADGDLASDVPARFGAPGAITATDAGYNRLAILAQKAGAARYPVSEELREQPMKGAQYVDANTNHAIRRVGEGYLRRFEVRDELLNARELVDASPNAATQIQRAFDPQLEGAEAIYRRYMRTPTPEARAAAQQQLGSLFGGRRIDGYGFPITRWKQLFREQFKERERQLRLWGWW